VTAPGLSALLARFFLASLGALGAGVLAFGRGVLDPSRPGFYCITVGTLAAGVLTLVRCERVGQALALAVFYSALQLVQGGLAAALASLVMGGGAVVVALVFDLLARRGFFFGKFLVAGPLLGGVFLAAAPIAEFSALSAPGASRTLLYYFFVGVLVGDGVGLGAELAELGVLATTRLSARDRTPQGPDPR
jgi:hypothetical protein